MARRSGGTGRKEAGDDRGIAASIEKAGRTLGYAPRYSSLDALYEALTWLVANGQVDVGGRPFHPAAGG